MKSNVSIVIITKNRRDELIRCINSLLKQKFKGKKEIVVVDSSDKPLKLHGKNIKYIYEKEAGIAEARNIGIRNSKYDLIAFIDDDCIVDVSCVNELVKSIKIADGVGGTVFPQKTNIIGKAVAYIGYPGGGFRWYYKAKGKLMRVKHISTCNSIFRKKILEDVGFFNEKLKYGGEDTDLSKRLIKKNFILLFNPNAIVYHKPRESLRSIFRWFFRRGIAEVYSKPIKEKIKVLFFPRYSLLRILFIAALIYFLGLYGFLLLYILIGCLFLKKLIQDNVPIKEKKVFMIVPLVLLTMTVAKGLGNLYGIFLAD